MTNALPLVSVIIPTYNRSALLPRAIHSVLNQTYKNLEIIIVDDASNDGTKSLVKNFLEDNRRIKYIRHEVNKGGSAARNSGIRKSRGEYIAFLDDDDEWLPEKIKKQLADIEKRDDEWGGVYCGYQIILREGLFKRNKISRKEGDLTKEIFQMKSNAYGSTLLLKKEVFQKVGLFDASFNRHQDLEFLVRFFREFRLGSVPAVLVKVHGHNFPKAETALEIKKKFFTKYKNDLKKYGAKEMRYIRAINYLEVANLFAHERKVKKMLTFMVKSIKSNFLNPVSYLKVIVNYFLSFS